MLRHLFFTLLLSPILGHPLWAAEVDDWPSAPVKFIVPFAPGGATDLIGRIVAQKLSETFKQQFIVENRPGAGASLGSNLVAKQLRMDIPCCSPTRVRMRQRRDCSKTCPMIR